MSYVITQPGAKELIEKYISNDELTLNDLLSEQEIGNDPKRLSDVLTVASGGYNQLLSDAGALSIQFGSNMTSSPSDTMSSGSASNDPKSVTDNLSEVYPA